MSNLVISDNLLEVVKNTEDSDKYAGALSLSEAIEILDGDYDNKILSNQSSLSNDTVYQNMKARVFGKSCIIDLKGIYNSYEFDEVFVPVDSIFCYVYITDLKTRVKVHSLLSSGETNLIIIGKIVGYKLLNTHTFGEPFVLELSNVTVMN